MKIGPLTQVLEIYQKKNQPLQEKTASEKNYDTVSISREAYQKIQQDNVNLDQELSKVDMGQLIDEVTSVDRAKVDKLKEAISKGLYQINPQKIADRLIDDEL